MGGGGSEDEGITGINVTPLVDVCLVLVIIFMVTAPLLSEPTFKVDLPDARTQEGEEKDKVVVTIAPDGRFAVDDKEFSALEPMLAQLERAILASRYRIVIFKADEKVTHGLLTEVMYRAKAFGARAMTIATEKKKEAG